MMRKLASFLTGVVVGGLVGATFALLFAPSTGGELQGKIRFNRGRITERSPFRRTE